MKAAGEAPCDIGPELTLMHKTAALAAEATESLRRLLANLDAAYKAASSPQSAAAPEPAAAPPAEALIVHLGDGTSIRLHVSAAAKTVLERVLSSAEDSAAIVRALASCASVFEPIMPNEGLCKLCGLWSDAGRVIHDSTCPWGRAWGWVRANPEAYGPEPPLYDDGPEPWASPKSTPPAGA